MLKIRPNRRMQQQMQKTCFTQTNPPQLITIPQHAQLQIKSTHRIQQEQERRRPKFCLRGGATEAPPSPESRNISPPRPRKPDKNRDHIPFSPPSKTARQNQTSINKLFKQKKRELITQQQKREVKLKIETKTPTKLLANESADEGKSTNNGTKTIVAAPTQKQTGPSRPPPFEKGKHIPKQHKLTSKRASPPNRGRRATTSNPPTGLSQTTSIRPHRTKDFMQTATTKETDITCHLQTRHNRTEHPAKKHHVCFGPYEQYSTNTPI